MSRLRFKKGVQVGALHPAVSFGLDVVSLVYEKLFDGNITVTSLFDSTHSQNSLHYGIGGDARCRAFDLRTRDLTAEQQLVFKNALIKWLGPCFDVILESNHMHVEYDPKISRG
jgi:hypothetical protein